MVATEIRTVAVLQPEFISVSVCSDGWGVELPLIGRGTAVFPLDKTSNNTSLSHTQAVWRESIQLMRKDGSGDVQT